MSNQPYTIVSRTHNNQVYDSYIQGNIEYIPVHLEYLNPKTRYEQIAFLTTIKTKHACIILGDFNIRQRQQKFVFSKDRESYQKLINTYVDYGYQYGKTTTLGMQLDKIVGSIPTKNVDIEIIHENGTYMDHYPLIATIDTK